MPTSEFRSQFAERFPKGGEKRRRLSQVFYSPDQFLQSIGARRSSSDKLRQLMRSHDSLADLVIDYGFQEWLGDHGLRVTARGSTEDSTTFFDRPVRWVTLGGPEEVLPDHEILLLQSWDPEARQWNKTQSYKTRTGYVLKRLGELASRKLTLEFDNGHSVTYRTEDGGNSWQRVRASGDDAKELNPEQLEAEGMVKRLESSVGVRVH